METIETTLAAVLTDTLGALLMDSTVATAQLCGFSRGWLAQPGGSPNPNPKAQPGGSCTATCMGEGGSGTGSGSAEGLLPPPPAPPAPAARLLPPAPRPECRRFTTTAL
jgi:hypothetical protein